MMVSPGQTLIISGASQGIGRALARALAAQGVNLVLNARGEGPLLQSAADCSAEGARVSHLTGDVSLETVSSALVARALALGDFAGFIHVAGMLHPGPYVWELDPERAAEVMAASFGGGLALTRAALPRLLEQGRGLAVFFGSGASERHQPGIGLYSAAKAAEEFLALQIAAETDRITAFVFRPGVAETRMQKQARNAQGGAAHLMRPVFKEYQASGALLTPQQAAQALLSALARPHQQLHGRVIDARDILD